MPTKERTKLTEGEAILLRSMFPKGMELTIKEIMKQTPYTSYERNNTYLKSLARKGIIKEGKVGKTFVYSIIPSAWASKRAFSVYALERTETFAKKHAVIAQALQELSNEAVNVLIVFGSYAKGTERRDSDIDVLIVSEEKGKIDVVLTSLRRRYGLHIHPVVIPKIEFAKIKNENKELWNSLMMHGILFKGYELFYHHAYET